MKRFFLALFACAFASLLAAPSGAAGETGSGGCSTALQSSYPKATIANGAAQAVLYLPDAKDGYYRASRFDWSGVIPCLSYKGHTYFGVWFSHYDPMIADAIVGPVEEFRSEDGALDYGQAKPGGLFVKIGVGVLRKGEEPAYRFMRTYPLVDGGKWTVHASHRQVSFRQQLRSPIGFAYDYEKTVMLDPDKPILTLRHRLKNTGTKTIDTQVYDHDFFVLDGAPSGPDMTIRFPFTPKAEKSMEPLAGIEGKQIVYRQELQPGQYVESYLTGYSNNPADYDIVVENTKTGAGVEQTGDNPISLFNFWSPRTAICPEAYHHLVIAPGQTAHWDIHYRFYAK
ncbi:MAG: hypothetical protein WA510_06065 [Acidobacteriaceae bacterium]